MAIVYVLNKENKPLMPTERCGHVRLLLKHKKASVVSANPFTIRLEYNTPDIVQPLYLGIDPGRTNIGLAVVTEDGDAVFTANLETRNKEVPNLMKKRKAHRNQRRTYGRREKRRRRAKEKNTAKTEPIERILPRCEKAIVCHDIKNKEARFFNRKRPAGWLTPTATHLKLTHINAVKKIAKFLPVSDVVLECNKFAFMQMDNPKIKRWECQHGPLFGYVNVEDAVYAIQNGKCVFCDKEIEHCHHIVPRRKNGSETLENRVGLCKEHHDLVHKFDEWAKKLETVKRGLNKKYHALSVLNQIIPSLTDELADMFEDHFCLTNGRSTKEYRDNYFIEKDHYLDACCIAASVLDIPVKVNVPLSHITQFRRHDRQACHKANCKRIYLLDGKTVAENRHKAIEQKSDSLEEFRETHTPQDVSRLTVKENKPQYKNMDRHLPGSVFLFENKAYVLQKSDGRHNGVPDYYVSTSGEKCNAKKCIFIRNNEGICFT